MSDDSSSMSSPSSRPTFWGKCKAIVQVALLAAALLFLPQILAALLMPQAAGGDTKDGFFFIVLAYGLTTLFLWWLMKQFGISWRTIGVRKLPAFWRTFGYLAIGIGLYYLSLIFVGMISQFLPVDFQQEQQLGFDKNVIGFDRLLVFMSLVVVPPLVEEIVFRGFLFSRLRASLPVVWSAVIVSLLFAVAHLQFGSGEALLWAAAIDTFLLSLILVYLRVKTGNIWAGVGLHACKNGVAFVLLFVVPHVIQ